MLAVIPIKFREDEAYIKSFFNCSQCKNEQAPGNLFSDSCADFIINNSQEVKHYCGSCIESVRFNCNCNQRCEKTPSKILDSAIRFYYVPCFFHPNIKASFFTSNFVPFCSECRPKQRDYQELSYSKVSHQFFDLFKSVFKTLCKDRRQKLVTYSTEDMLKACKWMQQISNGISCSVHPGAVSEFITEDLEGVCRSCLNNKSDNISLSNISQASQYILDIIKKDSVKIDPFYLNKYTINMLKFNSHTQIKTAQDLNLLILEFQELKKNKYLTARCVACLVKLTEGWRKGVMLKCGHSLCFKCLFDKSISNCPIDNEEPDAKEFIPNKNQSKFVLCNAEHTYGTGNIYKLPCFHHSCETHYKLGHCFQCGFRFDRWPVLSKVSKSFIELQKFYDIKCLLHNKNVNRIKLRPLELYCEKCEVIEEQKGKLDTYSKHLVLEHIMDRINESMMEKIKTIKSYDLDCEVIKLFSYIGIKNYNCRSYCIALLNIMFDQLEKIKTKKYFLATEALEVRLWPKKKFFISQNFSVKLKFSLNSDIILSGLILSTFYFPYTLPFINIKIPPISATINIYNEDSDQIQDAKHIQSFCSHPKKLKAGEKELYSKLFIYNFSRSVYMQSSKMSYELIVNLQPGYYYFSKAMSKQKISFMNYLKNKKNLNSNELVVDGSISSPLFGLCCDEIKNHIQ